MLTTETVTPSRTADVVVGVDGDKVLVELDVRRNDKVRRGDRYVYDWPDGSSIIMRVDEFKTPDQYTNTKARAAEALREGVMPPPSTMTAKKAFQRKLAVMRIDGELLPDGAHREGGSRAPDAMMPVRPISDDELARFATDPNGNLVLGLLRAGRRRLRRLARIEFHFPGRRLLMLGMPGQGKAHLVRRMLAQAMSEAAHTEEPAGGFIILDRKGEYIEDGVDEEGYSYHGLHHHPAARDFMVVVTMRDSLSAQEGHDILKLIRPTFSIKDVDPRDLADFLPGLTSKQADLVREYAYVQDFYDKLLRERRFGGPDTQTWFRDFPGLFDIDKQGKDLLRGFEAKAEAEGRSCMTEQEADELVPRLGGAQRGVLERAAANIKRFCLKPHFGGTADGNRILAAESCTDEILRLASQGKFVFVDLAGHEELYTTIAALLARKLLRHNTEPGNEDVVVTMVLEEAQNILSQTEVQKDRGNGSVFVKYAREGRAHKLGLVLVTQQPDPQSVAPQVVKTIDTVIALRMPPDDAKHLGLLKTAFLGLDTEISNLPKFHGVAVTDTVGCAVSFASTPTGPEYMKASLDPDTLEGFLIADVPEDLSATDIEDPPRAPSREERLETILTRRRESIASMALDTMKIWDADSENGHHPSPPAY